MEEKVKCPNCENEFDDFTPEADFIGWHGVCVQCFLAGDADA